jgi:hypothetical protein
MGFNKRKMEDERRAAAQKEAAPRRATDKQILEDAERLIAAWNERQAKRMPMLFSPTIGAAITARHWYLWVRCPACGTTTAIDLRKIDRHRDVGITSLRRFLAGHADHTRRSPNWCDCRRPASRMKCARSIRGGCSENNRRAGCASPALS